MVPGGTGRSLDRLSRRIFGTLAGACLAALLSLIFHWPVVLVLILGLSGFAATFFSFANYLGFVVFITCFVDSFYAIRDWPPGTTLGYRVAWTLAGGVVVLAATFIYPRPTPDLIGEKLALQAKYVKEYAAAVVDAQKQTNEVDTVEGGNGVIPIATESTGNRDNAEAFRLAAISAQIEAMICLKDSIMTPQKFRIEPFSLAREIMSDLAKASAIPAAIELSQGKADGLLQYLSEDALALCDLLVELLKGKEPARAVNQSEARSSCSKEPFSGAIASALQRLDNAGL